MAAVNSLNASAPTDHDGRPGQSGVVTGCHARSRRVWRTTIMTETPASDPLRAELERLRADFGGTVEALAAKTDVKACATHAASEPTDTIEHSVRAARDHAMTMSTTVADDARVTVASVRESAGDVHVPAVVRNPLTATAIAVGIATAVVVHLAKRRPS